MYYCILILDLYFIETEDHQKRVATKSGKLSSKYSKEVRDYRGDYIIGQQTTAQYEIAQYRI